MYILVSVICLLIGLYSFKKDKRLYSPLVLFASFWGVLIFLSGLHLYGLFNTSDYVYLIVFLGVVSFFLGTLFVSKKNIINQKKNNILNKKIYKLAVVVCICALYLNISFIFKFLASGFDIHYIYQAMASLSEGNDEELLKLYNPTLVIIQQFIGYPLLFVIVPISIAEYVECKNKRYLYIAVLLSLIRFLFDFRRTYLVIILMFLALYLVIRKKEQGENFLKKINTFNKKISLKKKLFIAFVIVLIGYFFSSLSSARRGDEGSEEYSLFSNFYYYYVGSLPYFSSRVSMLGHFDFTYGLTSFRGLFSPIFAILGMMGMDKPDLMQLANDNINDLHNVVLLITKEHYSNSYATCFFEFYLDGGIWGVVILSIVFGLYSEYLFKKCMYVKSSRYIWKYSLFISIFIYLSVLHFNGSVVCYIWPFIIEGLFYKRKNS